MKQRVQREAEEQAALINWASYMSNTYPELELLFHIPNGGSRNKIEAANLKRQGVKAGVPDLFLPAARGKWHGLFIEMKAGKNKETENQTNWMYKLSRQGYLSVVCYGWERAAEVIQKYLNQDIKLI